MQLTQLEYLIAVHDFGSMHEASRQLHISQQCISKAIKDLEEELHIKIFDRQNKGAVITTEGEDIYIHAVNIKKEITYLESKYKDIALHQVKGRLDIYCPISYSSILENTLVMLKEKNPAATINLIENDSALLLDRAKNSAADEIILLQSSLEKMMQEQALLKNKYSCYLVKKERIKILMSKASLYAQHESLSKQIVSQLPFALKSTDGETESTYLSILKEHGITLNIQFLSNAIPTMINLIAKGSAYAFTTDSTFSEMPKKQTLCAVPIKGNIDVYTFLLIRNEPTPIAKRFFEIFQSSHKLPEKLF